MANCVITKGLELGNCQNNTPGISDMWVLSTTGSTISLSDISYSGTGEVTGLTGSTTGEFKKIDLVRNSNATLSEEVDVNTESLSFTFQPQLQFQIPGWNQDYTNLYEELVKSTGSVFIVKLKSGKYFLASPNGMFTTAATINSGAQPGDNQLYDITVQGIENESIPEINVVSNLTSFLSGSNLTVDRE
jgi:hypothetical protein